MFDIKHLGDITKISGYTAPIVDCIVGGSPCQDLSIAGKRAGLDGERSGLFMDQVRIVKEMRDRDVRVNGRSGVDVRPRYLVWENVPGAFSSNKGEDFRIVLEEIAKVKDKDAVIPRPEKWQTSGCHETDVARTIDTTNPDPSKNQGGVAVVEQVYTIGNGQVDQADLHEKACTLNCMHDQQAVMIASVDCRNGTEDITNGALQSMASNNINSNNVVRTRYTVRRLTPLECERLQGYPDGWTDIGEYIDTNGKKKQSSDAARYKALGNSIALPPWKWVMKRLCACYERDATLASLFDGIGGFPYIWEQINGKGSCLWASEIEEFPIAVTKVRIGE